MAHQVIWTRKVLESFIDKAMLSKEEEYIMRSRCQAVSVKAQAEHLKCSEATVHRMIARIKVKYDAVQKEYPEEFPLRKESAKETYLDTH